MKDYVVYILSNSAATFYIGVTGDIDQRIFEHGDRHDPKSFVSRYNLNRLVFMETYPDARQAIAREKQLKGWSRAKKIKLICEQNPEWRIIPRIMDLFRRGVSPEADPSTGSG